MDEIDPNEPWCCNFFSVEELDEKIGKQEPSKGIFQRRMSKMFSNKFVRDLDEICGTSTLFFQEVNGVTRTTTV